jgi:hypothetical protein
MLISVGFQSSFVKVRLSTLFFWRVDRLLQGVDCFALLIDFPMVYILFLCFRYSNIKERNRRLVGRDLGPALHLLSAAEAGSIVSPSPNLSRVSCSQVLWNCCFLQLSRSKGEATTFAWLQYLRMQTNMVVWLEGVRFVCWQIQYG